MSFTWLVDKILQVIKARTKINVLVHEAFLIGDPKREPHYFVKVVNLSPETMFTITHIWETWFRKDIIKDRNNVFKNVRVVLSNGRVYKSKKNLDVRPAGFVAK